MQKEGRGLRTCGTIVEHGSDDLKGRSYKIRVMKTGLHNNKGEETHEGHPNISRRLPHEGDVKANRL